MRDVTDKVSASASAPAIRRHRTRIRPWRSLRLLSRSTWLDPSELRIGLGCMRLSTDEDRDEERALATIAAAASAGITVFDTARAYGHEPTSSATTSGSSPVRCARAGPPSARGS